MKKISLLAGLFFSALLGAQEIPDDFISFSVPGYEKQMEQIRAIYYEAYMNPAARPGPSFWDVWTPVPLMSVAPLKADIQPRARQRVAVPVVPAVAGGIRRCYVRIPVPGFAGRCDRHAFRLAGTFVRQGVHG